MLKDRASASRTRTEGPVSWRWGFNLFEKVLKMAVSIDYVDFDLIFLLLQKTDVLNHR